MLFAWPLSGWGYGPAPFRLGIWTGPFSVGDMDWPLFGWGYGPAPFQLGIWTGPFSVGDMDWPLFRLDRPLLLLSLEERMEL